MASFNFYFTVITVIILENSLLAAQLRRKGVDIKLLFSGGPIYLDLKYIEWCKKNGKPYAPRIILRVILWVVLFILLASFKI